MSRKQLTKQVSFRVPLEIFEELTRQAQKTDDADIAGPHKMARAITIGVVTGDDPVEANRNRLAEMRELIIELKASHALGVAALLSQVGNVDPVEAKKWAIEKFNINRVENETETLPEAGEDS